VATENSTVAEVESIGKIRLTETPPVRCSSCYGQYPDRTHVDFGAAWDGPVLGEPDGVIGGARQVIDDLIICEDCLRDAGRLLGLEDPGDAARHLAELEGQAEELRERLLGAMDYIAALEGAAARRGLLEEQLTRGGRG
jgi:hypothetical protein